MSKYLLYWWAAFCLQILGAGIAFKFGVYDVIYAVDPTYITTLITSIHVIASLLIGYSVWKKSLIFDKSLWYVADTQMTLGMIGTLIGFIIMFKVAFVTQGQLTPDINTIKNSISEIGSGMGIAIRATLLGIMSTALLKGQLLILEHGGDDFEEPT